MRRTVIVLATLLAAPAGRLTAQGVVFGVGGQLTGEPGGRVRVPVYADLRAVSPVRLGSYTLRLTWDPAVLLYVSSTEGTFGQPLVDADSAYLGVLKAGGLSPAGMDGLFDLFTAEFAVYAGSTPVAIAVTEAVQATTFADLTPQVTVVGSTYCAAVGRWGDLDGDGDANSRDALAILSALVGLPVDPAFTMALGDVDGDALVNSRDALITLSYAVGLDIPGQRVLVLAPGAACAAAGATGVTILPDTVDVAVGQETRLLLSGAVNGLPAGTSVNWAVANPEIAVVTADGLIAGRAAGTTTVTAALGPGITASVPVIVRARRGTWHVDAGRAALAGIQLGTTRYPFATPQYAFLIVQDGDTVRVAPGVHDYLGGDLCTGGGGGDAPPADGPPRGPPPEQCARYGELTRSIVMLGDTLPDGTRPVLRGNPDADWAASLYGPIRLELRDLELRGFQSALYLNGPVRTIEVQNTRFDLVTSAQYSAFELYYGLDTLILRDVEIVGDSIGYARAGVVEDGAGLVVMDRVVVDRMPEGFYLDGVDSLDVRDSRIAVTAGDGFDVYGYNLGTRAYLARNVIEAPGAPLLMFTVRSVTSERNVYRGGSNFTTFAVFGASYPAQPGTRFRSLADSILVIPGPGASYAYGLEVDDLDTLVLDSAVVVGPDSGFTFYPGYLYGAAETRVEATRFLGISGLPLNLAGRRITVTNSEFAACRVACGVGAAVYAEDYTDPVGLFEVTGSTFDRTYTAIQTGFDVRRVVASGNTMDSVSTGFLLYADSVELTGNVVTRAGIGGGSAVQVQPRATRVVATLQGNRLLASLGGWALYALSTDLQSSGNYYAGTAYGLYLANTGATAQVSFDRDTVVADSALGGYTVQFYGSLDGAVRRSRIVGGGYGLYAPLSGGSLVLDSNVVTGSRTYGLYLTAPAGVAATGRWNNVTGNAGSGIYASGAGAFGFTDGRYVGNALYGLQAAGGTAVNATNNWWGDPAGPGNGIADSVSGTVTTTPFLTTDPAGVSVPPLAPPAGGLVADVWRAPIGSRRAAPPEPATVRLRDDRAERAAWRQERRAEMAVRIAARRAEHEQQAGGRRSGGQAVRRSGG